MDIIQREQTLPDNIHDLKNLLLIGREKYNLLQRKISLIDKTGELKHERDQILEEGQYLGGLILHAESKIGELLHNTDFTINQHDGGGATGGTTTLKELGFSKSDSSRFQKIYKFDYVIDDLIEECKKSGTLPTRKDLLTKIKIVEKEQFRTELKTQSKDFKPIENLTLINDEFQNVQLSGIDCIITDPPYLKEYLPLYDDLRDFSERVLKPSGFLIFYINPQILHDVIVKMSKSEELIHYWNVSLIHTGSTGVYHFKSVFNQHKTILIYQKKPFKQTVTYFKDVIQGTGREKEFHDWQQSGEELYSLIETFTNPNDTIVDCCAGSGTTGIQSLSHGRKSILIEKDSETFKVMEGRFKTYQ